MKKNTWFVILLFLVMLIASGCSVEGSANSETFSAPTIVDSVSIEEEIKIVASDTTCTGQDPEIVSPVSSLRQMVEDVTGEAPSSVHSCFSIFNLEHGNKTNMLYVKNGEGLNNLPAEVENLVFIPWKIDLYVVGGPPGVAALATIDEDTIILEGGMNTFYKGSDVVDIVDWSTVSGGEFIHEVRFESSRIKFVDNLRYWTAYCGGNEYTDLVLAINCGKGK